MSEKREQNRPPINIMGRPRGGPMGAMMNREKPKNAGQTLKRLAAYIAMDKNLFFALMSVMILITVFNLAIPSVQGWAIDKLTDAIGGVFDAEGFVRFLVLLATLHILNALTSYLQGIFSAKLSQRTVRNMRSDLFSKIVYLPIKYFDTHRHGDIMSRMTNDVQNISNTVSQSIGSLISGTLTVLGTLVIMLCYSPALTAVSMITIVLTLFVTRNLTKFMRKMFVKQQELLGSLNAHSEETITGSKTIAAYILEEEQKQKFDDISNSLKNCSIKAQILGGSMGPLMNFISNFGYLLIAATGGFMAWKSMITVGTIQAFLIYTKQFSRPINEIANQFAQIQTAMAGAERVFAVMDSEEERQVDEDKCMRAEGNISFKDVCFSYKSGEPVIRNFSLDVKAGQKIALVGATGSGKTTIVNLLTRFYDIDSGEILIDGKNILDIPKGELRENIAIVLQDTVLFHDKISANIAYGKLDASMEEISSAAKMSNADVFIERFPEKYDTMLSEGGQNLSEGQRQLLSISRAVLKNPQILILDEATSNVDTRTELNIQKAMIRLMKNRTSIIIAHRLSTIRDADMIVVLDNGEIAEMGSHEELLNKKGRYFALYSTQFAGGVI